MNCKPTWKRLIALCFAILLLVLFLSTFVIENNHMHCTQEHCPVCMQINQNKQLKESALGGFLFALFFVLNYFLQRFLVSRHTIYTSNSLVKNKIRFNC